MDIPVSGECGCDVQQRHVVSVSYTHLTLSSAASDVYKRQMLYELAALRKEAEPILGEVRECDPENAEAYRLLRFLRYFNYIPDVGLPGTSLLREFLGGGSFRY